MGYKADSPPLPIGGLFFTRKQLSCFYSRIDIDYKTIMAEDKRKYNRGKKGVSGRKKKADEDRIRTMSIQAICNAFGSEQEGWDHLAEKARKSFPHFQLLWGYTYGKPKESVNINPDNDFNIPITKFFGLED